MLGFRTNKQKRRNAERVHGLISGESNLSRPLKINAGANRERSKLERRPMKQAPFTREQGEQAIVNTLQKKLRFNVDQARMTMEYAKKFKNPRVLTHFLAHVVYRAVGDLNIVPLYGNFRIGLNQKNLGTYTRSWKIFFHRIDPTWANYVIHNPLQASTARAFFSRQWKYMYLSVVGVYMAFWMHQLVEIFASEYNQNRDARWNRDRMKQKFKKIAKEFLYWSGQLANMLDGVYRASSSIPTFRRVTTYATRTAFIALLKQVLDSFADNVSTKLPFGRSLIQRIIGDIAKNLNNKKKKSSVTLTNITNNGGRKKNNVATRSNANNNSGGRKKINVATRSNANNNNGGRKRNNVATRSNVTNR